MNQAASSPFLPGTRIVDRAHPESGSLVVSSCLLVHGYWRVTAQDSLGCTCSGPAEGYVRAPRGWREPPRLVPAGTGYADLPSLVPEPTQAARAEAIRELARWWCRTGRMVARDGEARGIALHQLANQIQVPA